MRKAGDLHKVDAFSMPETSMLSDTEAPPRPPELQKEPGRADRRPGGTDSDAGTPAAKSRAADAGVMAREQVRGGSVVARLRALQPRPLRRRIAIAGAVVLVLVTAVLVLRGRSGAAGAAGMLQVNGRIEGDLVAVAPRTSGRIVELLAREGDEVARGQLLARLDDAAADARLAQARASLAALKAQAAAQQSGLELLRAETSVQLAAARAGVQSAQADVRKAQAAATQEGRDLGRMRDLAGQGFVGPQAVEKSELAHRAAHEQASSAHAALARARETLRDAELRPQRIRAREADLQAVRAQADAAAARADEAASQVADLNVGAPVAGRISSRYVNLGEVVAAGTPLFGLTDLAHVYLKGYLPEAMIGRVRLGQAARIWTDAHPGTPYEARVGYIASRAEFTPKEVQTRDERVKLVYEVRLYPASDPAGALLPGQPADAVIRLQEDAPWQRPKA